jgi:hypothetical protein
MPGYQPLKGRPALAVLVLPLDGAVAQVMVV